MENKGKIVSISNEKSSYFKEKAKVLNYLPEEKVELFLLESEIIVCLSLNDIAEKSRVFIPKSRKDFYQYIQDPKTCRLNIVQTTQALIEKGDLKMIEPFTKENLVSLLENEEKDKTQIVDEFRNLRDEGKIEFLLVNSIFVPQKKKPFKHKKQQ